MKTGRSSDTTSGGFFIRVSKSKIHWSIKYKCVMGRLGAWLSFLREGVCGTKILVLIDCGASIDICCQKLLRRSLISMQLFGRLEEKKFSLFTLGVFGV